MPRARTISTGQITLRGGIGEAAHTVAAHAPGEGQLVRESGALLLGRVRRLRVGGGGSTLETPAVWLVTDRT